MTPMEREIRHWLGVMATGELAEREAHYPRRVQQGRMSAEEADTTIRIWRAIATLFSQRAVTTSLSWAELEHELDRAVAKLDEVFKAKPGDKIIRDRLGAVGAMVERIRWHRAQVMGLPAERGSAAA